MQTEIGVHYAKQNLSEILRRVQRGEEFVITNRGEEVAVLSSAEAKRREKSSRAVAELRKMLREYPLADSLEEIFAMRDEGKKW